MQTIRTIQKRDYSRKKIIISSITIGIFLLIASAFYQAATGIVRAETTNKASMKVTAATSAMVNLQHVATGNAKLTYDASAKTLAVNIALTGLAPNSTHPAHIHLGSCTTSKTTDPIQYPLNNVVANGVGEGYSKTTLSNIASIPATGWYINVHNGPNLQPAEQFTPIACGDISRSGNATQFSVPLGATNFPNENASGTANLQVANSKLTVTLSVKGLVPNSAHAAHIHAGSCASTGKVLYDMSPLQADAQGNVSKTITFNNVSSIPTSGWNINVHYTNDLSTQTGYNPILCGDVNPSV